MMQYQIEAYERRRRLPPLINYMLSHLSSKKGMTHLGQMLLYEVIRLKLPALLRVLQTFTKSSPNSVKSSNDPDIHLNQNHSNNSNAPRQSKSSQHSYVPGDKADRLKILAEVQKKFFEDEWKLHADEIKEEVVHLFNIEKQLSELSRTLNIEKKEQQWESLKRDVLCFVPYSIVSSTLLITSHFLHQLLNTKHSHYLTHNFPALHDPQEIAKTLLHDFMEQTQLAGLKNIKAYFKQKLTQTLQHLPVQEVFNLETIFEYLDEYFLGTLLRSNSTIKRPSDHRKRSSMTLFRNGKRKSLNSINSSSNSHSSLFSGQHVNFTDFNEVVNFSKLSNQAQGSVDHQFETMNSALFAGSQPIVAQRAMLDIMYLFLGDVSENKILTDSEFVEKHIEIADCKCREQRYQPSLQCIPEDEGDDEGYESDKSDQPIKKSKKERNQNGQAQHYYQHKVGQQHGQTEKRTNQIEALTKVRKYSFDNDENQQEPWMKPPRRRKLSEGEDIEFRKEKYNMSQSKEEEDPGYKDDDEENDEEDGQNGFDRLTKKNNKSTWKSTKSTFKNQKQLKPNLNSKVNKSSKGEYFQHQEFEDEGNNNNNNNNNNDEAPFESLKQYEYLDAEKQQDFQKSTNKSSPQKNHQKKNKSSQFNMNLVDFQQSNENDVIDYYDDDDNQEESNVYYSKLSKNDSYLDEEDIAENRQRLSQFVQSLCSEAVEILSSVNFQSYLYYAVLFQYSKLKNRVRLQIQENGSSKHMALLNFLVLINRVINDHFLASDAPDKGKNVYRQARLDAQAVLNSQQQSSHNSKNANSNMNNHHNHQSRSQNNSINHHNNHSTNSAQNSATSNAATKNKLILLKLLLDEIEQSRTIRQSFEQLTHFFALS